jgi:hypothetical protein
MQQAVDTTSTTGYTAGPAWNTTAASGMSAAGAGLLPAGPSCQPCPACGGLNCLCRPRFFAGQLLTEQDLNRLDQYIVAKNQLHNRYLVGRGVVSGLDVTCSPCTGSIAVSAGYAIDTCGNDIIVCTPDVVDICKLINACTPNIQTSCGPYQDTTACKDMTQDWILAIRYQETPSRGATALTGAAQCGCASSATCSCGSVSKACGCGSMQPAGSCCGQTISATSTVSTKLPRRGAPPSCEPTLTCEVYNYEVFKAPAAKSDILGRNVTGLAGFASLIGGEMFASIACCVEGLLAIIPPLPAADLNDQAGAQAWSAWCCNMRMALIQYVSAHGGQDCQALAKLRAVTCPSANANDQADFYRQLLVAVETELLVFIELILDCVCTAALPPCPAPGDPRVPLARVRVRGSDCTIVSVCDWTTLRKNVVTTKTLGYWLGWLPFVPLLREFMQEICCAVFGLPAQLGYRPDPVIGRAAESRTEDTVKGQDTTNPPITFAARKYTASNPISEAVVANLAGTTSQLGVGDLLRAMLTPVDPKTPPERLAESPHARVLAEIARPLVNAFGPLAAAASGKLGRQSTTFATTDTVEAMRAQVESLQKTVATQQTALDALRKP